MMDTVDDLGFLRDRPFSCLEPPLSLQNLAATNVAFQLSIKKFHDRTRYRNFNFAETSATALHEYKYPMFSCREVLAVPSSIGDIIDERIKIIVKGLDMWEKTFWNALAREKHFDIPVEDLDSIVCKSDGTICFQDFVRNFLAKTTNLDPMVKFRVACFFCLEDRVREIWPSISGKPSRFEPPSLIQYWKNVLKNVPIEESFIASQLSFSRFNRNWASFEYFWSKLADIHEFGAAITIATKCDCYFMTCLLRKLNRKQVQHVCQLFGSYIFDKFIAEEEHYEDAMKAWTCTRHFVSDHQFFEIVLMLWKMVFNPLESELVKIDKRNALLLELWSSSPDSLKSCFPRAKLFAELDYEMRDMRHYNLEFVFELLSDRSYPLRKDIWINNWRKLVIRARPCDLERLMELCFDSDEEIEHVKEDIAANLDGLADYFGDFIDKAMYSELSNFLGFFVKIPRRLENLSKKIILSNIQRLVSCSEEELTMCHSFIRNTFRDEQSADKFINEFTSSPECLGWIRSKLDDCCFDQVMDLYIIFPTSQTLREIMPEVLDYCHHNFARGQISGFDEKKFAEFVSWCSLEEEKISELKKSLIIDDIFEIILMRKLLENRRQRSTNQKILSSFDQFLFWYFGSWEAAKFYKSTKTLNYKEWPTIIREELEQYCQREFVDAFLNWSFDGDEENVKKVKFELAGMDMVWGPGVFPI